jgi:hypothetical protein
MIADNYLDLGWSVLPVRSKAKEPATWLVKRGHLDASNDPFQVAEWFKNEKLNVGIACELSGLLVLDFDYRNMNQHSWEVAKEVWCETMAVMTGDGVHLYFTAPQGLNMPGKLTDGIDIKYKGYVVGAPSIHPSGKRYEWNGKLPVEYPAQLIKKKEAKQ